MKAFTKKIVMLLLAVIVCVSCVACDKGGTQNVTSIDLEDYVTINLWYADANMTAYMEEVANKYHETNSYVTIIPTLVSADDYFESIYNGSIKEDNIADIFMMSSDNIEKAYLMGLIADNDTYTSTYSKEVYGQAAITAASYKGKLLGYPLTFDMPIMVYNKKYTGQFETFEEITEYSDTYEHTDENEEVEIVINWDVSDQFLNYAFVGAYMNIGGENSEDKTQMTLEADNIKKALNKYVSFKDSYGIIRNTTTLSGCIESFKNNHLLYTILKVSDLSKIESGVAEYGVQKIPDIDSELKSSAFSVTQFMAVNPYSPNIAVAKSVAKAMTYDYAGEINSLTGYVSARGDLNNNPDSEEYAKLHDIYAESTVKAKFMEVGDVYVRQDILFHQVWDDGNIDECYQTFSDYFSAQATAAKASSN